MTYHKKLLLLILSLSSYGASPLMSHKRPRLAILFVVDQLGFRPFEKVKKHFSDGLHFLATKGVYYTNFHHPHGKPATATGHAALSTGTWPKYHGYVDNDWLNPQGELIGADDDKNPNAAQLSPTGVYPFGKSPHQLMVDTLADQVMISSEPGDRHEAFALSLKSRSTIPLAGRAGKALWFDEKAGGFTSSKVYFTQLPRWVKAFNTRYKDLLTTQWQLRYPQHSAAYNFDGITNYENTEPKKTMIGKRVSAKAGEKNNNWNIFLQTPAANQLLLDLARAYLDQASYTQEDTVKVLWVSLSSLDLVGHIFGPDSLEYIDMLYHLDKQLGEFMQDVYKKFAKEEVLFALTSDHGTSSMSELMFKKGISTAVRVNSTKLIQRMNSLIEKRYKVSGIVKDYRAPQFYLDEQKLARLEIKKRTNILYELQDFLQNQPGIRQVWRRHELAQASASDHNDFITYYKNQLFPGRSGHLICHVEPYNDLTNYSTGVSHRTPYHYDTHSPLMLYRKNVLEKKIIRKKSWSPQFAVTIAHLLGVPKPSASCFEILPGL